MFAFIPPEGIPFTSDLRVCCLGQNFITPLPLAAGEAEIQVVAFLHQWRKAKTLGEPSYRVWQIRETLVTFFGKHIFGPFRELFGSSGRVN